MSWSGRKVMVTGAGGFIGSHLCERLVALGAGVTGFVRYTSRRQGGLLSLLPADVRRELRVVAGDLRDPDGVARAIAGHEVVFHLGALIAIPYSYVHPTEVADVNVMGTVNVLNAARRAACSRIVHTSTSETYGTAQRTPIDEEHPIQPQSPYSASKIGADALAASYHHAFGLPVAILRPFNTYGPRQSGRAVIPTIVGQALWRDRVELGSLAPTRDFTFVADTVAAFLAIAACDEAIGTAINAGTGTEVSIGELAERVVAMVDRDVPVVTRDERIRPETSEVFQLVCDPGRARALMGWTAQTDLDTGLARVISFMQEHPDWTAVDKVEI